MGETIESKVDIENGDEHVWDKRSRNERWLSVDKNMEIEKLKKKKKMKKKRRRRSLPQATVTKQKENEKRIKKKRIF